MTAAALTSDRDVDQTAITPEEHISPTQWAFTGCCFLMGTILRSGLINSVADNESWLIGLTGAFAFLPMLMLFYALTKRYPGMNLFEIADASLGRVGGFIAGILLVMFYLMLGTVNLMEISSFVTGYLIRGAPLLAVTLAAALAMAYVLRKGIGALTRLMPIITILAAALVLMNFIQSLDACNFNFLLPIFNRPLRDYGHATIIALAVPYGESLTLFALLPMVKLDDNAGQGAKKKTLLKPMLAVVAFTCVVMVVVHVREVSTLGSLLTYTALPSYEVMRMINIGSAIARTESIYAIQLMTLSFIKAMVIMYALARGIAHLTRIEPSRTISTAQAVKDSPKGSGHKAIALPVCLFAAVYATAFHESPFNNMEFYVNAAPLIWLIFEGALPALMLAIGVARSRYAKAVMQA